MLLEMVLMDFAVDVAIIRLLFLGIFLDQAVFGLGSTSVSGIHQNRYHLRRQNEPTY